MPFREVMEAKYRDILTKYIKEQSESTLYIGQKFSRKSIENQVTPEEIISLHKMILQEIYPDMPEYVVHSFDILLEIMLGYGFAYREHQSLRDQQKELRSEIEIAANVQQTLLETKIPSVEGLDIGAISVPARLMNGDYYNFVEDENDCISIAIADVIGKGIPAALCMSMIKYAMDSIPANRNEPSMLLENLNRVVEQNVDRSMFITMFYGMYDYARHVFSYASAGHEPGFYYDGKNEEFSEIYAKGLMLGIDKKTKYRQYEKNIHPGDMIILLSDGVTECRTDEGFVEKETLLNYIRKYIHCSAQEIVNNIFKDLEKLQDFQLRDDFTLIIIKRRV
ncbi:phosphoserine phosphatase RsbU [Robertmurraya siralis]|uniref:Phosphoserine phosphatase RsbU n=1 Tax=Robertmurraya siralis TaxID=77777 RepID=A0A920BVM0_9BACI|nr:PP2C family protein-serine/threonine phosphatase [Robertmurraya siralis]PAE19848.1 phosphoserine phosphatase [Bacillus sp. 7504-2]GIN63517.1 phosphoserine phosphatase RsbU [Robertmurraya siralis]